MNRHYFASDASKETEICPCKDKDVREGTYSFVVDELKLI